ncbi:MAG: rhomboid family intramembrane serine protease [Flavobacteriaceae bacterium]|jgi:membrane associated rhomboid family serine protease|nr:rhomboid family intramembrane serine protease [Flavobacteriaceae bacterium]|tara:strand:- start:921 stop:1673 length:753 start_codon:yes stop_codon:yes gene_type:complete
MNRISPTVKQLLIINVIFYFGSSMSLNTEFIYSLFSLHFPENPDFKFWQLITHMFMHGGILHLAFNMFALWMFGSAIESIFGSRRFIFFYITCGLGAALAQIGFLYYSFYSNLDILTNSGYDSQSVLNLLMEGRYNTNWGNILGADGLLSFNTSFLATMVGASGAIMGVLVAFGMFFPESKLMLIFFPIPIKAKYFIPGIILLDLFSAITGQAIFSPSNTAYIAHIGGALTGFLIMYYWKKNQFNQNRWY